jgi:hypothetical protein
LPTCEKYLRWKMLPLNFYARLSYYGQRICLNMYEHLLFNMEKFKIDVNPDWVNPDGSDFETCSLLRIKSMFQCLIDGQIFDAEMLKMWKRRSEKKEKDEDTDFKTELQELSKESQELIKENFVFCNTVLF